MYKNKGIERKEKYPPSPPEGKRINNKKTPTPPPKK